jgi:hypothetical protein
LPTGEVKELMLRGEIATSRVALPLDIIINKFKTASTVTVSMLSFSPFTTRLQASNVVHLTVRLCSQVPLAELAFPRARHVDLIAAFMIHHGNGGDINWPSIEFLCNAGPFTIPWQYLKTPFIKNLVVSAGIVGN